MKLDSESTVMAGNASGQNDGAAMCVVTTRAEAERRGLRPLLTLRSWAVAGVGPEVMGIGPVPATTAALARAGLTLDVVDERLNPNGSGISLGHPAGATGADPCDVGVRVAATRVPVRPGDDVHRWRQGLAAVFERAAS